MSIRRENAKVFFYRVFSGRGEGFGVHEEHRFLGCEFGYETHFVGVGAFCEERFFVFLPAGDFVFGVGGKGFQRFAGDFSTWSRRGWVPAGGITETEVDGGGLARKGINGIERMKRLKKREWNSSRRKHRWDCDGGGRNYCCRCRWRTTTRRKMNFSNWSWSSSEYPRVASMPGSDVLPLLSRIRTAQRYRDSLDCF